jgi:hypothetical protein
VKSFRFDDKYYAYVEMRQGLEILFKLEKQKVNGKSAKVGKVHNAYFKSGYTNCCEALLRGEPSLQAMQLTIFEKSAELVLGDGTKRFYQFYQETLTQKQYLLAKEVKSNGNRVFFTYFLDGPFRISRISTTNKDENFLLNELLFRGIL